MNDRIVPILLPLLACVLALPACDGGGKKKAPVKVEQQEQKQPAGPTGPKKPGQEIIDRCESAYTEAKDLVKLARKFRDEGKELEAASGPNAAKVKYRKAKQLYKNALQLMEDAIEPDLNDDLTQEQVDAFLKKYTREMGRWGKENSSMGKVPG